MLIGAVLAAIALVGAAIIQQVISLKLRENFLGLKNKPLPENHQRNAVVLLSVRGCDPSLMNSIRGLLNQDYAKFEIHVVVDHETDPGWERIHQIKSEYDDQNRIKILTLKDPGEYCSLKCHALAQAVEAFEAPPEYVCLIDADVTPHRSWLKELLGPLLISTTGGVTGNQWFEPPIPSGPGALCRSAWNGGCMILSINFCNPWAGSFAMRYEDLVKSKLIETWKSSAVDDGPIADAVHSIGKQVVFSPSLIMINRESCSLAYTHRWTTRMLTWSRMHEKTFFITVAHAIFSNTVMLTSFIMLGIGLAYQNWIAAGVSTAGLVVSGILSTWAYSVSRSCAEHSCLLRGETLEPLSVGRLFSTFWMVAPSHLLYGLACFKSLMIRRIKWRGIHYELTGGTTIKRLNYEPFESTSSRQNHSI